MPFNNPELINASSGSDANASPFVIAVRNAGISAVPSIMNVVILIAVLSVGNSSIYGSSRTIAALADQGQAPKILGYVDQAGRPLVAILFSSSFGLLGFLACAGPTVRTQAFDWMVAISGLTSILAWASICFCHIRFRAAWKYHGHTLDELPYRSQPGVIGSWIGLIFNLLVLVAQFWTGFAPVGYAEMSVGARVESFFEAYISFPIVIGFFIFWKIWKRTSFMRAKDIDVVSGRRELDLTAVLAQEEAEQATWPWYKRTWHFFC